MSSRYTERRTRIIGDLETRRMRLAETALGATVTFKGEGDPKVCTGRVVFADYDTLAVLVKTDDGDWLVSFRDCMVRSLRAVSVPVLHGARLDVWRHGERWRGVGIADVRVAALAIFAFIVGAPAASKVLAVIGAVTLAASFLSNWV